MSGHNGEVLSLAITQDGQFLASASYDSDVRLWNPKSGELIATLTNHTQKVTSVSFAAHGELLASKSADNSIRLWHVGTWKTVATMSEQHSSFDFASLAFHPKLPILATLGHKEKKIRIWDLDVAKLTGIESR